MKLLKNVLDFFIGLFVVTAMLLAFIWFADTVTNYWKEIILSVGALFIFCLCRWTKPTLNFLESLKDGSTNTH